jgi:hypothetical protein
MQKVGKLLLTRKKEILKRGKTKSEKKKLTIQAKIDEVSRKAILEK